MKFQSRKGLIIPFLMVILALYLIWVSINADVKKAMDWYLFTIVLVLLLFLIWTFLQTHYTLNDEKLIYRCGPFHGEVKLEKIDTIIINQSFYFGVKYGLAMDGLIIKYNKYDDLYISPDSNHAFIDEILKLNSKIKIED